MPSNRLPQVAFFQGFEAAARNLSFTKALPVSRNVHHRCLDNSSLRWLEIST
jgi:hypothetical protein